MPGDHMHPPDTSIVVVTYNNRADIDVCLRSLQEHSPEAEIIVVDNLSSDGTLDHIHRMYPTVSAISSGRNGGFGAGVNLGASLATGTYLAVINPDTQVQADWLIPLIDALQCPCVGLATPTILLMGTDDRVNACGNDVHLTGLAFCAGLGQPASATNTRNRPVAAVSGAAFMLRRSLWEELGGFDERFFMYLEDTDLSLRARRLGYDIVHVPESHIRHTYTLRVSPAKLYHLERNRLLMVSQNLSPMGLMLLAPAFAATEALTWLFCLLRGPAYVQAKWRSYRDLLRGRSPMLQAAQPPRSPSTDRVLIHSFGPRLALEQMQRGPLASAANVLLTMFYTVWRVVALIVLAQESSSVEATPASTPPGIK